VACFYNGDGVIANKIQAQGIPVIDLGMSSKYRVDAFWRLARVLRAQQPAILHTWMFHANITGRILGRATRVPVIITSERTMGQEGFFRRWLNRSTASLADSIVCVSQSVADFATQSIHLPAQKIRVIRNGIELDKFEHLPGKSEARKKLNLADDSVIIGAIGRPRAVKGYPMLIDAFSRLAPFHPSAALVIIGQGPDLLKLQRQARAMNLDHRILFLGDQTDIPGLLPALDVLALPSLYEGMPNVAIEAMAAGLPVVATGVGGTLEVVVQGETGFLVPASDPAAFAKALSVVMSDPGMRIRLGQAGRQRVYEQFNILSTVQQTQALYDSFSKI
jgi:glycosyltransferase involved in cell wall biosynthesis